MKLSERQRRVISSMHLQARTPLRLIADETGYRESTVRHCLDALRRKQILTPLTCIDVSPLGLTDVCAYYSYLCHSERDRQKLLAFLRHSPDISVAAELCGEYQYTTTFCLQDSRDVTGCLDRLAVSARGQLVEKSIATRVSWCLFRPKFLSNHPSAVSEMVWGASRPGRNVVLDDADRRILTALARCSRFSDAEIARLLGMPKATVERRIKRLEEARVILGYAYAIDMPSAEVHSLRLLLRKKQGGETLRQEVYEYAAAHPNITSYVHCVGNWDFELSVRVEDLADVPGIVQAIYGRFHDSLLSIRQLVMVKRLRNQYFDSSN